MKTRVISTLIVFMLIFSASPLIHAGKTQVPDGTRSLSFDKYYSYDEVKDELVRLSNEHPDIVDLRILGQTYEGRDIMAVRVTDNPQAEENEPDILIMGGHHANELPSVEVPLYILQFLVDNYTSNGTARRLVDSRDIWFVPLVNPDGREYFLDTGVDWRKNRRPFDTNADGTPDGYGVDINRNYGHRWGELPGTSHSISAWNYCGPSAFSENESLAIRNLAMGQLFDVSLSYHTYGELIYYPWNNNIDTTSPQNDVLEAIASEISERNGYYPMQGADDYPTTGDSDDWLYSEIGCVPFTIELCTQRFPPDPGIEELCRDNLDAALYVIEIAVNPEQATLPDWTFMAYMAADNSLNDEALININEMEVSGSTGDVKIVVLYDGQPSGDSKIFLIEHDSNGYDTNVISTVLDDAGQVIPPTDEVDMSDPSTLRSFVDWAIENYPAQNYALDLWGHGTGVLGGFCTDGSSSIKVDDIGLALTGFELDIVGFDTCFMGNLEVAHELIGITDYFIGSAAFEPAAGWDYERTLSDLISSPNLPARDLAYNIVSDYLSKYSAENDITQAALDMYMFEEEFIPRLNDFVNVSMDFAYYDYDDIWNARNITDTFPVTVGGSEITLDFYEFITHLSDRDISEPVSNRIESLKEIKDWLIVHSGHGIGFPDAETLAIYFPPMGRTISSLYDDLSFSDERWDEYLAELEYPLKAPQLTLPDFPDMDNITGPYFFSVNANAPVDELNLLYRIDNGSWISQSMSSSSDVYTCSIDGQPNGTAIDFYFQANYSGRKITEPYEVKWGQEDYYQLTVIATCDVAVTDLLIEPSTIYNDTLVNFTISCENTGSKDVLANLSLTLSGAGADILIGWELFVLSPGTPRILNFNWTAIPGNWTATATIVACDMDDIDSSNQNRTFGLNVTAYAEIPPAAEDFTIFLLLALVCLIPLIFLIFLLRKARQRRKRSVARIMRYTRDLIQNAEDFDIDASSSYLLLAKAETAFTRGAFNDAEQLAWDARESAMIAVGTKDKK